MRILVVEDEAAIADFIERGLRAEGHAVEVAADGPAGQARALGTDVDLVLLDVMLPGKDGIEVLRAIRERKPSLPVLMLTARGEVSDRVAGLDAGATDYIVKPFAFAELACAPRRRSPRRGWGPPASRSTCSPARSRATGSRCGSRRRSSSCSRTSCAIPTRCSRASSS
jgi:DNA-binding response OmpR family regulator